MLTKTNFLTFLNCPMHLWAEVHKQIEAGEPSIFGEFLKKQGYDVEELALRFIKEILLPRYPQAELVWQHTYYDGDFSAKADAVIYDKKEKVYDVFEIKQSTSVDLENEYDLTFQTLIYEQNFSVRNVHILHLNKDYVRQGDLNLEQLFIIENLNQQIADRKPEVLQAREIALQVATRDKPDGIDACTSPGKCPCPTLCHPSLPDYPIYDLMGGNRKHYFKLRELNISRLAEINGEINLNPKQQHQIEAVKSGRAYIDPAGIHTELDQLTFPLYFLDYETCGSAVPLFNGYKPQQNMVFQYSLHTVNEDGSTNHSEYLSITKADPALPLLDHLSAEIGAEGSVVVWNKTFEMCRNKEMAERYPQYRDFLDSVNNRVYDLADSIRKGYYIHPDFHGSWSIKNVLPVLVPGKSYEGMDIAKGDQAMAAWLKLVHNIESADEPDWIVGNEDEDLKTHMLKYCELDTLAMVDIWKHLKTHQTTIPVYPNHSNHFAHS